MEITVTYLFEPWKDTIRMESMRARHSSSFLCKVEIIFADGTLGICVDVLLYTIDERSNKSEHTLKLETCVIEKTGSFSIASLAAGGVPCYVKSISTNADAICDTTYSVGIVLHQLIDNS